MAEAALEADPVRRDVIATVSAVLNQTRDEDEDDPQMRAITFQLDRLLARLKAQTEETNALETTT